MMYKILFWIYLINSIFLINHEIDSGYQEEWKLFKMKGGITLFLILHFPMLFLILFGLTEVYRMSKSGLIYSAALSIAGIFAFFIHRYFIKKGSTQFTAPVSQFILTAILIISLVQISLTGYLIAL